MKIINLLGHVLMTFCVFGGASVTAQTINEAPPPEFAAAEAAADNGGTGPHAAIMTSDPTLPTHTVYRPADLTAAANDGPLPIIVWGNGACHNVGNIYRYFLIEIASHGYFILAIGTIEPSGIPWQRSDLTPNRVKEIRERAAPSLPGHFHVAIDWAITENERADSEYFGLLDIEHIAVMGHSCGGLQAITAASDPRVKTLVAWCSGTWAEGLKPPNGGVATKAYLNYLHTPVAYISGSESDPAFHNSVSDYEVLKSVPVLHAWRYATAHAATYMEPGGGEYATVGLAWLDWQLKGDEDASRMFMGADCTLCTDEDWGINRKGW